MFTFGIRHVFVNAMYSTYVVVILVSAGRKYVLMNAKLFTFKFEIL